jgi:hypothetical protein
MVVTEKYVRKPLYVDVVRITMENMHEVADWCQGEIKNYANESLSLEDATNQTVERYIHVRVHNPKNVRQTKAFINDYLLYTERGYKVYTEKAFKNSFELVEGGSKPAEDSDPVPMPEVTPEQARDESELANG